MTEANVIIMKWNRVFPVIPDLFTARAITVTITKTIIPITIPIRYPLLPIFFAVTKEATNEPAATETVAKGAANL